MNSIRTRLLISHSLPLLIIILLAGLALDYVIETRILLPGFADELANEAKLLAKFAANQPQIWAEPQNAQDFLARLEPVEAPYVSIFGLQGRLMGSTDPFQNYDDPLEIAVEKVHSEDTVIQTAFRRHLEASVVDVFVPVYNEDKLMGVIQMTYHLEDVYGQFLILRRVIIGVLTAGLILGTGIALVLSVNFNRSLKRVMVSVHQLAMGQKVASPTEKGPEEIRDLIRTVTTLMARLQTIETTRRRLLVNLVHELGRPLGALLPAVQALEAGAAENVDLRQELLAGMEDEINILRRLLDDLTGLYDQFAGSFDLKLEAVNLTRWLSTVIQAQREAARVKGLKWQSTIPENLPVMSIDPDRLAQALGNLVHNAIKFTPPGGTIAIGAGTRDNQVWIEIKDSGPGIPVKDQELIFTPFFRGRTETRFPQGMGLGLSIARDLVMAHQGHVEVKSVPGEGSSFTIWLPYSPA